MLLILAALAVGQPQTPTFVVENKIPTFSVTNKVSPTITKTIVQYRQAVGHSHTCPYDGTTWDHASNPGHNCPVCGRQQLAVDQPSRMVPVTVQTSLIQIAPQASGCANGACALPQRSRLRLFP